MHSFNMDSVPVHVSERFCWMTYYRCPVAQPAERTSSPQTNRHLRTHKPTLIVWCVALAGSNTRISI